MKIDESAVALMEDELPDMSEQQMWFAGLKTKYTLNQYVPPAIQYQIRSLYNDGDFLIKPVSERKNVIKEILAKIGIRFLSSGTNRFACTCDYDDSVIIKFAYNPGGLINGDAEMFIQDKLAPLVTKTFEVSEDGMFSLHERVVPLTDKMQLLQYADQHFTMLLTLFEKGYIIDDVGTNTFRNLGIRPGFGLVILDYPIVRTFQPAQMRCKNCTGRIMYDAGFNTLKCRTCGRAYTTAQCTDSTVRTYRDLANKLNNQKKKFESNYNGGIAMKFGLVFKDKEGNVTERRQYDTRNIRDKAYVVKDNKIVGAPEPSWTDKCPVPKLAIKEGTQIPVERNPKVGTKKQPASRKQKQRYATMNEANADKLGFDIIKDVNYAEEPEPIVETPVVEEPEEMDADVQDAIKSMDEEASELDYSGLEDLFGKDVAAAILSINKPEVEESEDLHEDEPENKEVPSIEPIGEEPIVEINPEDAPLPEKPKPRRMNKKSKKNNKEEE